MRIRLHGTPCENQAALTALATVLEIHTMSRPYPDRPPSTKERIYLDAVPRHTNGEAR
ncbi:MAG TPA: hypothetical protein VEO01_00165 [Pseudonocardiaceae bacterium]|nr:hypothetical protein [Pseudonocardiaceae bacterium]